MRFHVLGLPNYPTGTNTACAYGEKVRKFIKMMTARGHECVHYGLEGSKVDCEHVTTMDLDEQKRHWGDHNHQKDYSPIQWDANLPYWSDTAFNAAYWIRKRCRPGDFLCLITSCQLPVVDMLRGKGLIPVEYGVGYYGTCIGDGREDVFRCFESYSHMHHVMGRDDGRKGKDSDGRWYDCVVPNYFDAADFPFVAEPDGFCDINSPDAAKHPYALFIGRVINRKGVEVAVEATRRAGISLLIAGQGVANVEGDTITATDGGVYKGKHLKYVGFADANLRAELMGNAVCGLVPTQYVEPFGGVACEMMLCGTPVVTTDWGAFTETVRHGLDGFRCRRLAEFALAIEQCKKLDRLRIHQQAIESWSLDRVGAMYEHWFEMLVEIHKGNGYDGAKGPANLDWLRKVSNTRH